MKLRKNRMHRKTVVSCLAGLLLGGSWVAVSTAVAAPAVKPAEITSVKGTCTFGGKESTWSAKLTPKGDGTYDADYVSSWGGAPLRYVGTIKTDLKTEISGTGKAHGGRANGNFEFSGKYGANSVAKCSYTEISGHRSGTLTAEMPK